MGIRKDLDKTQERFIYYLTNEETVLYVGTSANPINRYRTHLKKIKENNSALIYRFCHHHKIKPVLQIVSKHVLNYNQSEVEEIKHIEKHQSTCLNFYNNPDKDRLKEVEKTLI